MDPKINKYTRYKQKSKPNQTYGITTTYTTGSTNRMENTIDKETDTILNKLCVLQAKRDNTQPCFPCSGTGAQSCRFCTGIGNITVELGGGEKEVSRCINCDGAGSLTCTTCQGSGIQPRYLDRREFKDDD